MKVNERKGVLDPRVGGTPGVTPADGLPPATGSTSGDQVSVSETARELARLRGEVDGVDDGVAGERVASLQAATARGAYLPDVRETAERLLRDVLEELLA